MSVDSEVVQIPVPEVDRPMVAWLARSDDGRARPAVLLLADVAGVNQHIRELAERLVSLGVHVLAPNLWHRSRSGLGDAEPAPDGTLVEKEVLADLQASVSFLMSRPYFGLDNPRLACVGFGIGGHAAFLAACEMHLRAGACFYPTGLATRGLGTEAPTLDKASMLKGRVGCFFAGEDVSITAEDRARIGTALDAQGPGHSVVTYDQVDRGFFSDRRTAFDSDAAKDAWMRLGRLLTDELGL